MCRGRKRPARIRRCLGAIKVRQHTDSAGNVTHAIELKLAAKTPAIDLAMKHPGLFGAETENVRHSIDWDSLYRRSEEPDPIE